MLSLSKHCSSSVDGSAKKGRPFDKLRPNGGRIYESEAHAAANRSKSSGVVFHPRLTRIMLAATCGSRPIAGQHCARAFMVPDEQALP